jgi:DNA-binding GntR family transcriptional regulator
VDDLAVVRSIDGPFGVESALADLRCAIISGDCPPCSVVSLRELSSARRVRLNSLIELARGLERDGLATVRGDVVLVNPLDRREVARVLQMRRALTPALVARGCELASPQQVRRVAAVVPEPFQLPTTIEEGRLHFLELYVAMMTPAASSWEQQVLRSAYQVCARYERFGYGALDVGQVASFATKDQAYRFFVERAAEFIELYRARKARALGELIQSNVAHISDIAHHGLEVHYGEVELLPPLTPECDGGPPDSSGRPRLRLVR